MKHRVILLTLMLATIASTAFGSQVANRDPKEMLQKINDLYPQCKTHKDKIKEITFKHSEHSFATKKDITALMPLLKNYPRTLSEEEELSTYISTAPNLPAYLQGFTERKSCFKVTYYGAMKLMIRSILNLNRPKKLKRQLTKVVLDNALHDFEFAVSLIDVMIHARILRSLLEKGWIKTSDSIYVGFINATKDTIQAFSKLSAQQKKLNYPEKPKKWNEKQWESYRTKYLIPALRLTRLHKETLKSLVLRVQSI